MPTVGVHRDQLFQMLGRSFTDDEFDTLCFEFGVELDEVTSEKQMKAKETGVVSDASDEVIYKIDVAANRYDLLCIEGIARALRVFLGMEAPPKFVTYRPPTTERMVVKPEVATVRPFVVAAIMRDISFTDASYQSFIDLQEKLHQNICRKRTLVAIGTHDYDTIQGPFTYEALQPEDISFKPLNQTKVMNGRELMQHYESDLHIKKYLHIIRDSPRYPVIYDANRVVLSLPPIINGDHSKISVKTKNVFIEATATDLTKAKIVLNTIVAMFGQYLAKPFTVEQVEVISESQLEKEQQLRMSSSSSSGAGEPVPFSSTVHRLVETAKEKGQVTEVLLELQRGVSLLFDHATKEGEGKNSSFYPDMSSYRISTTVDYLNRGIGITLKPPEVVKLLMKMGLESALNSDQTVITVEVPPTRSDIMQACDVMEDVAIAYGYNNVPERTPKTPTFGGQLPINKLTDLLRREVAFAGFTEVLTFALCSIQENFDWLNKKDDSSAVKIANPKTFEFQIVRTTLLPGILKTISSNRRMPLPLQVFEIADVVVKDASIDVGARNVRHLCAVHYGKTSGFEVIHGLLDFVMRMLHIRHSSENAKGGASYHLEPFDDATYFHGRCANVVCNGKRIGVMGIVHPEVCKKFELSNPCSALEISIEEFL